MHKIPVKTCTLKKGTELIGLNVNAPKPYWLKSFPVAFELKSFTTLPSDEQNMFREMCETYFARFFKFKVLQDIECTTTEKSRIFYVHPSDVSMEAMVTEESNIVHEKTSSHPSPC